MAHIYVVSRSLASYHITVVRTSLLSEKPHVFYGRNGMVGSSFVVSVSALVPWLSNKYVKPFVGKKMLTFDGLG